LRIDFGVIALPSSQYHYYRHNRYNTGNRRPRDGARAEQERD
jgi:hypothetical protein